MSTIETLTRPERCPACGSPRVAYLLHGLQSNMVDLAPKITAEETRFANRKVSEDAPQWHCCACHHEWGVAHLAPLLRSIRLATLLRMIAVRHIFRVSK